jgi:hypothetical protein
MWLHIILIEFVDIAVIIMLNDKTKFKCNLDICHYIEYIFHGFFVKYIWNAILLFLHHVKQDDKTVNNNNLESDKLLNELTKSKTYTNV